MGFSRRYKRQKGGAPRLGIDIKSIASFLPSTIPGLIFWVQATEASIQRTPVNEYAAQQTPMIRLSLMDYYSSNLTQPVITEIRTMKGSNALVRLEAVDTMSTYFPTFYQPATGEPPGFDISMYKDTASGDPQSVTLMTKEPFELPDKHTILVDGTGISTRYNTILDRVLVTASEVSGPPAHTTDATGKTVKVPSALFREILVYDHELTPEQKQQIEGYFAYRGNTQYLLPPTHPYLPDLTNDPVLEPPLKAIGPVLETLSAAINRLKTDYTAYTGKVGVDGLAPDYTALLDRLNERLDSLQLIRQLLSKGVLLARAKVSDMNYTLEDVYGALNAGQLYKVPLSAVQIEIEVKTTNEALQAAKDFLPKLATADQQVAQKIDALDQSKLDSSRAEAETEERLRDVEAQARRREFVRAQLRIREELDRLGNTLLNPHMEDYLAELETTKEAFQFQDKQRRNFLRSLDSTLAPLRQRFATNSWKAQFPFLDPSGNPTLDALESAFQSIRLAAEEGDIAYLTAQMDRTSKETVALLSLWSKRRSASLFRHLYVAHVRQAYARTEKHMITLAERIEEVQLAANQLTTDLATLERTQKVTPFRPTFAMDSFLPLEPIYYAKLSDADAALLNGYSHIRTDAAGVPRSELNATGDLDVQFMFPELMEGLSVNPSASGQAFSYESGYKDSKTSQPVLQTLFLVSAQAESILSRLPPSRIPPLKSVKLEGLGKPPVELGRDLVNTVIQISLAEEAAQHPIALPRYAVQSNSFYCIQNLATIPLWIRNPGAVEDTLDLIGPSEVRVYMYGEGTSLSSTPGFAYGHQVWQEGRLPYDTLLNCPRSATAVHVTDLKATVYCTASSGGKIIPLLDREGFFVPVIFAPDGNVYDPDDFAMSNPYSVHTLPEMKLADLLYDRKNAKGQVRVRTANSFPVVRDSKTGELVLCSAPGIPAGDQFGLCKFIFTPALRNGGVTKCKGSGEDIELQFPDNSGAVLQPLLYPEGLSFERVFRSQFCKPLGPAGAVVFTTAQELPLIGPTGNLIPLPANSAKDHNTYVYAEPAGTMNRCFLLSQGLQQPPIQGLKAEQVPYVSADTVVRNAQVERKAQNIISRFVSGFEYSKGTPKRLIDLGEHVRQLGEVVTESIRASIQDAVKLIEERLKTFVEFEGTIERLQRAMRDGNVPADVTVSLGVLELKLRDQMLEIMDIVATVQKPLDNYVFLLDRRNAAVTFVKRMREFGDETFKRGYDAIQRLYKIYLERTKSISSPEMDLTMAQIKEKELKFKTAQGILEGRVAETPDTVSEIREWLLSLQQDAAKQFGLLQDAENLVTLQLLVKLRNAEEADVADAKRNLDMLRAQADEITADAKRYAGLFETREAKSELQDPAIAAQEKGPFQHLKTPSLITDLRPVLGEEVVQAFTEHGGAVAALWSEINSKPIPRAAEGIGAAALASSVGIARENLGFLREKSGAIKSRLGTPFQVYDNAVKATYETQKGAIQSLLSSLKSAIMELDTQRIAIVTAAQSLAETLTEEEKKRLKNLQTEVELLAKRMTMETVQTEILRTQPILSGIQMNPFAIAPVRKGLEDLQREADALELEMKVRVQTFQEFRQGLLDRLGGLFDEQRRALKGDYDTSSGPIVEQMADKMHALMEMSTTLPNISAALDAIGRVGELRAAFTATA